MKEPRLLDGDEGALPPRDNDSGWLDLDHLGLVVAKPSPSTGGAAVPPLISLRRERSSRVILRMWEPRSSVARAIALFNSARLPHKQTSCKMPYKAKQDLIVGIYPLGVGIFQTGVRRRKYKLGRTEKFPVQIFASLSRVYISSSSPQSEKKMPAEFLRSRSKFTWQGEG